MQSTCHDRYSDTMAVVSREILARAAAGARVLDIPAGAGRLGDSLREHGLTVVGADINGARPDTVMADMTRALPFRDGEFDVVVCMEGIEHIDNYHGLIGELARVTRPGGTLILTMPNIACLYSRLMFMCTGSFFQFWPTQFRVNVDGETLFDYGHITPLTWQKVAFHFAHHGVRLEALRGNKMKRKILWPIYLPFVLAGLPWTAYRLRRRGQEVRALENRTDFYRTIERHAYSRAALTSRNIVMVMTRKDDGQTAR
ncbi:MAG: class I SAM-dependent methyltransferase [Lentisphaerae bacterium]|nr:class I SAM-dependent methyltransferase [Lentisphaerota bacterium]